MNEDVIKQFEEEYLPEWCHKKHFPKPKRQFTDHWKLAWNDYIKEVLNPNWNSIRANYLNMEFKLQDPNQLITSIPEEWNDEVDETDSELEDITNTPATKSDWEIVQEMLNDKKNS